MRPRSSPRGGGVSIAALGLANALVSKPTSGSALALKPPATWGNA
jgi:hypothetical protein